jgi:acetolactate synthase-1/2/3 large subunit
VLFEDVDVADADPLPVSHAEPGDLGPLRELLAGAERPIVIVGEGGWSSDAHRDVRRFAETWELPVAASFRCQDYVDNHSPSYAGHLTLGMDAKLAARVHEADVVLAIGSRLGDISTKGYTLLEPPRPKQTLAFVHPDAAELRRVFEPALAIRSDLTLFAAAAAGLDPPAERPWRERTRFARSEYVANLEHRPSHGDPDLGEVFAFLRRRLPPDAVVACGAGNFTVWVHRFYEFSEFPTQLAPRAGAMGYGLPAALAAKALDPKRLVVCVAGDGDLMMSAAELATAVQYGLPVIVVVVDNGMYGTIRMHQERLYPGRISGTELVNPDFAALAASFGWHGENIERTEDVEPAFERAVASRRPAVLALRVDPEVIHPRFTISELRASA